MAKKSLEEEIQRMEDVLEVENLLGRWQWLHGSEDEMGLWAEKTPGVRETFVDIGVFELIETGGVRRFDASWAKNIPRSSADRVGKIAVYNLTTPIIEVAGDGKTAKAVFIVPAPDTTTVDGKPQAVWHWVKHGWDIVKEDGKWKVWHYRLMEVFCATFERGWIPGSIPLHPVDKSLQNRSPNYPYSTTTAQVLAPIPPEPYETFDEKTAY